MIEDSIVSIIIVSYNSVTTIERTIKSIKYQTYENIEIVFVDGGSTDGTRDLITQYANERDIVVFEPDNGIYDAMNKGVENATGEYKFILNSDDMYMDKTVIEKIIKIFKNDKTIDIVVGEIEYFKDEPNFRTGRVWRNGQILRGSFINGWHPPHPAFFVKAKCYGDNIRYQIDLKIAADYELMLRMIHTNKFKTEYLEEITTLMESGGTSGKIKSRLIALKDIFKALKRNKIKLIIPYIVIMRYVRKII